MFKGQLPFFKNVNYQKQGMDRLARFANSLKLRMAIHIASVEPETAKKWAEEAVQSGVIESVDGEAALFTSTLGFAHPLIQVSEWGDSRMGASFESLLMSLDHPYSKYLFMQNSDPITKTGTQGSAPAMTQPDTRIIG
ncbi:MAG: SusD/RagB family nutrient-binding outer membrane lipoprotein, partial [Bacteroidales bacterium]|nr:SusD/RagB family nutrient-binding outer membrane lipoprotein [Bacteroidales bacterium]